MLRSAFVRESLPSIPAALVLLIAIASAAPAAEAGTAPDGFEFIVSTWTTGDQTRPLVASRGADGFVIVWASFGQAYPSADDVFVRLFDADMNPMGAELPVNTHTMGDQSEGRIAANGFGEFIVVWTDWSSGDGSGQGVKARRYDSLGMAAGGELQVNSYTTGAQYRPEVSMDDSGAFVVVWASNDQDGNGSGVFGQRFDSAGAPTGGEFAVNTYTPGGQNFPMVSMDDTGSFTVAWTSFNGQDGSEAGIHGRRFDSLGAALGGEFLVNTYTTLTQRLGAIAHLPGGGFVVAWSDGASLDGSGYSVQGQLFDSAGAGLGAQFQVNTTAADDQRFPSVGADEDGTFVVAWTQTTSYPGDYDIFGQRYLSDGTPLGLEFQANSYTTGAQRIPDVAAAPGGDLVVTWIDNDVDGSGHGVIARSFFGNAPEILDPRPGDMIDCSDPKNVQPTFTWTPGNYDGFKIYMSSTPNFIKGTFKTSGDSWLKTGFWTVKKKKWKSFCTKALAVNPSSPMMYLRILGKDNDLSKKDRAKKINTFTVPVELVY